MCMASILVRANYDKQDNARFSRKAALAPIENLKWQVWGLTRFNCLRRLLEQRTLPLSALSFRLDGLFRGRQVPS